MRTIAEFTKTTLIGGVLVLIPVYLSVLLLLKALGGIVALVSPITAGLPETLPLREVIAMLLLIAACFACGVAVRTGPGRRAKDAFEHTVLERIPGYALIGGLAGKIAGKAGSSDLLAGMKRAQAAREAETKGVSCFVLLKTRRAATPVFRPAPCC